MRQWVVYAALGVLVGIGVWYDRDRKRDREEEAGDVRLMIVSPAGVPAAETGSAKRYLAAEEVEALRRSEYRCAYVVRWNAPAYYDPEGRMWNGIAYDAAIFPVFNTTAEGFSRTLAVEDDRFVTLYLRADDLSWDWQHADWARTFGNYDVEPTIPNFCSNPAKAKGI